VSSSSEIALDHAAGTEAEAEAEAEQENVKSYGIHQ